MRLSFEFSFLISDKKWCVIHCSLSRLSFSFLRAFFLFISYLFFLLSHPHFKLLSLPSIFSFRMHTLMKFLHYALNSSLHEHLSFPVYRCSSSFFFITSIQNIHFFHLRFPVLNVLKNLKTSDFFFLIIALFLVELSS